MKISDKLCFLLAAVMLFSFCSCAKIPEGGFTVPETRDTTITDDDGKEPVSAEEEDDKLMFSAFEDEDIRDDLNKIFTSHGCAGAQVAVIKKDGSGFCYEYGTADRSENTDVCEDTKFRVASLSKLVTAMVFMCLKDEGLADTDENIETYLGFKAQNPRYPDVKITPRMLMCHSSSITDSQEFLNSRLAHSSEPTEKLASAGSSYASYKPGSYYNYSNFGFSLIGAISEKITNTSFETLAQKYLFTPLGTDAAYVASDLENKELLAELYGYGGYTKEVQLAEYFRDEPGATHHIVQGNLTISAKDYAKIISVLLNGGVYNGKRILSEASVEEILSSYIKDGSAGIGYGTEIRNNVIEGKEVCLHTGSNFGMFSTYMFSPEDKTCVVVLTSGDDGAKNTDNGVYDVCLDVLKYADRNIL